MERARSAEGSVFKKKPSDFMQMFKVCPGILMFM
jgi:hypothetical protein